MGINCVLVSGPVIIENGRLLVIKDGKDPFYKIPGGKVEGSESAEACAGRELREETGLMGIIYERLSTYKVPGNNGTSAGELVHYRAKLQELPDNFDSYTHGRHTVFWLPLEEIKSGIHNVAPNVEYLVRQGALK